MAEADILLPYQKRWVSDNAQMKLCEKSRRIGISWCEALASVLEAAPKEGARNTYYMGTNKDMTRQFIEDCALWAKRLDFAVSPIADEYIVADGSKDIQIYRINFASGAEIAAMPARPDLLRSKQGRAVLDEAAFSGCLDGFLKAASAFLIWGGQIVVISTHNGSDNLFNVLCEEVKTGKDKRWSHHRYTFRSAIAEGFYKRVCLVNGSGWSEEKEAGWVRDIYEAAGENAEEELDAVPSQAGGKYFSRALLNSIADGSAPIIRWDFSSGFLFKKAEKKEAEVRRLFKSDVLPYLRSVHGRFAFGMDFGRSGDLSVIWAAEDAGAGSLPCRFAWEVKNAPFREQELMVRLLLDYCRDTGKLIGIAIDGRGNGAELAENASLDYPGYAVGVSATAGWYAEWIAKTKSLMESGDLTVPEDEAVLSDFSLVRLKEGAPSIPKMKEDDRGRGKRHADAAVACVLCVYAVSECAPDAAPSVYPAGRKRFPFFDPF